MDKQQTSVEGIEEESFTDTPNELMPCFAGKILVFHWEQISICDAGTEPAYSIDYFFP